MHLSEFIDEFNLKQDLYTEEITESDISNLENILSDAVDWATQHMIEDQQHLQNKMEEKMHAYQAKLEKWTSEAMHQLDLDFNEKTESSFWNRIKDTKSREIQTILDESSQYINDLTSLQGDPYLKVLAVFYNN
jgi:uncharacterized membrane protein YheB (UPF0754 family)